MSTGFSITTEGGGDAKAEIEKEELLEESFVRHRIFLNYIDTAHAKHIASFITDQVYGATRVPMGGGGEGAEEMGEEEEEKTAKTALTIGGAKYQIVGCLQEKFHQPTEDIFKVLDDEDFDELVEEILKCGFVIFDITNVQDDSQIQRAIRVLRAMEAHVAKIKETGPKTYEAYDEIRVFILISSVMTWGMTKPIDPDEPDTPFTEMDYRKRRPHPNYKDFIQCERDTIMYGKKHKEKLKTFVICSGVTYGLEEDALDFYFKMAWNNQDLPVFGGGSNYVPLIHIKDLVKVVHGVCERIPNKPNYILAVEQTPCKMKQVVKALAKAMGTGRIKDVVQEEAFLYNGVNQKTYETCTVNLNMEPAYIVEELEIEWQNELSLAENMAAIVAEFRTSRKLHPLRVVLHGPPASGKTKIAKRLCEIYGAHYISVKTMIEEKIQNLKDNIQAEKNRLEEKERREKEKAEKIPVDDEGEDEEVEEEEEEFGDIEEMEEQLRDIENTINFGETGKLPDEYVVRLMKDLLKSNVCQNQGYILDGYPKNMVQVKELFGQAGEPGGEEAGEEEGDEGGGGGGVKILPEFVISLEATDDFLCNRIMQKPESDIQGTHYEEEPMLRRLAEFRVNNTEDNTILNFFDELEIHPKIINVMDYNMDEIDPIIDALVAFLGPPVLFEPTVEEEREAYRLELERKKLEEEEARLSGEIKVQKAAEQYFKKMEEWTQLLEDLQMEEEKLLVAQSEPLRNYLMKFVFPTLTKGLIETARVKPDDPVDFLAEYLFKENPEGRMFDPAYTREGILIEKKEESIQQEAGDVLTEESIRASFSPSVDE